MVDIDMDNFIRCHAAIQVLCDNAVPCILDTLNQWHLEIQTPSCTNPSKCPSKKKPTKTNGSCEACVKWGVDLMGALYVPPKSNYSISWKNVNPTLLGNRNPVESAKAFVLHLPEGEVYTNLGDFDAASLLMIMKKFNDFHKGDRECHDLIDKVCDIRNKLSHMKIKDKLYVDSDTMEDHFKEIIALANDIRIKRPGHFTKDLTSEFNDIKSNPITSNMKSEALKQFSEAKKCAILLNMQEDQRETNQRLEESMNIYGEKTNRILEIVEKSNNLSAETQRGLTRLSLENVENENVAKGYDFYIISNHVKWEDEVVKGLKLIQPEVKCVTRKDIVLGKLVLKSMMEFILKSKKVVVGFVPESTSDDVELVAATAIQTMLANKTLDKGNLIPVKITSDSVMPLFLQSFQMFNGWEEGLSQKLLQSLSE